MSQRVRLFVERVHWHETSALVPCTRRFSVADTQPRALPHVPFSQRRRRACTGDPHPPRLALCVHAGGQTHLPRPRTAPVTASPPRQRCIWPMPPDGGPYAPPQHRNAAAGDYVTAAGGGRVCLGVARGGSKEDGVVPVSHSFVLLCHGPKSYTALRGRNTFRTNLPAFTPAA